MYQIYQTLIITYLCTYLYQTHIISYLYQIAVVNSFVYASFNYCPLVWHFSTCERIRNIEKYQKRCMKIVLDAYGSDHDTLLRKSEKLTMEIKRLRLIIELLKFLKNTMILIQTL